MSSMQHIVIPPQKRTRLDKENVESDGRRRKLILPSASDSVPMNHNKKDPFCFVDSTTECLKSLYQQDSAGNETSSNPAQDQPQHGQKAIGPGKQYSETTWTDVLCGGPGEGSLPTMNPGNLRFATLIDAIAQEFHDASRPKQLRMAQLAAMLVHEAIPAGRFLIFNKETGLWHAIAPEKAWYKALRTLMAHPRLPSNQKLNAGSANKSASPIEPSLPEPKQLSPLSEAVATQPAPKFAVSETTFPFEPLPPPPSPLVPTEQSLLNKAVETQLVEISKRRAELEQSIAKSRVELKALVSKYSKEYIDT